MGWSFKPISLLILLNPAFFTNSQSITFHKKCFVDYPILLRIKSAPVRFNILRIRLPSSMSGSYRFFSFQYIVHMNIIYNQPLLFPVFQMDIIGMEEGKINPKTNKKLLFQSFLKPDVIAFLTVSVFNGLCHFYIDTYFAVFMMELGASDFLLS
jgi:hypothetical protein